MVQNEFLKEAENCGEELVAWDRIFEFFQTPFDKDNCHYPKWIELCIQMSEMFAAFNESKWFAILYVILFKNVFCVNIDLWLIHS